MPPDAAGATSPPPPPVSPPPPPVSPPPPPPPAAGAEKPWHESVAFGDDSRKIVTTKGWKSPDEMVASYAGLEAKVNAKGVIVPGEKATPEERTAFHRALGVPETPDKYDLGGWKPPEGAQWDAGAQGAIVAAMHREGATPGVVRAALASYGEWAAEQTKALQAAIAQAPAKAEEELRGEWGAQYDTRLDLANRAMRFAFGDDLADALQLRGADGTFRFDNPKVARAFAKLGETLNLAGDGALPGSKPPLGPPLNLTEARARRAAIVADPDLSKAATDRTHPRHKQVMAELDQINDLIAKAEGGTPKPPAGA